MEEEENDSTPNFGFNTYYGKKDETLTFKTIILRAVEKCRLEMSKEMNKGGTSQVFDRNINTYITINQPNQQKLWQQCVMALHDLLLGKFDKKAIETIGKIDESIKNAYQRYYEEYLKREIWIPYKQQSQITKIITIGEKSAVGTHLTHEYEDYVFSLYRKMYQELILLYSMNDRLNEMNKEEYLSYNE